ncbi:MAG: hypothetical protein HYX89_07730 [Chloroflexi bacterium]|nr:hypothetical protein [Chloroflexota bacterium]
MSRALVNRFLHAPITRLKQRALDDGAEPWYANAFSSILCPKGGQ